MPTSVYMPQMGEAVYEGVISKWLKAKGERVEEGEPLLEINTDKVDSEVLSPASGVLLEALAAEGATVAAGSILAWVGAADEAIPAGEGQGGAQAAAQPATPAQQEAAPAGRAGRELGFISPLVARIAAEHGVDLSRVRGTGQGGRITKKDVEEWVGGEKHVGPSRAKQTRAPLRDALEGAESAARHQRLA
ncbi:MAG: E3 binding domain-containing protein, partial [Chloroflexi bacterium]|nr:E3 binding domain-containing protein [Chloroflexota bacterium]